MVAQVLVFENTANFTIASYGPYGFTETRKFRTQLQSIVLGLAHDAYWVQGVPSIAIAYLWHYVLGIVTVVQ